MFGKYALPSDDLAGTATSVTASAEDAEYPAGNLIAASNTGHLNLPSRPAKLTTTDGYWDLQFSAPITVGAVHIVYPNFPDELQVTLEPDGGTPIDIPIFSPWENGWTPSPFLEFTPQTSDLWRLNIGASPASQLPIQVGRLLLYESFRQLGSDVRWGVVEEEEQGDVMHETEGRVELFYELFGPRRSFVGELAVRSSATNNEANELIVLYRDARNRIQPWTLIPDADLSEAWFVRFVDPFWSRTRANPNHNIFPFRVRELSRGLPFP